MLNYFQYLAFLLDKDKTVSNWFLVCLMLVDTGSGKKLSLCGVIVSSELGIAMTIMGPSVMAEINKTTQ